MPLLDQIEKLEKADLESLCQGYREIIAREARGCSREDDAPVLAEILKALKKTPADFARDAKLLRSVFQAEEALNAAQADPVAAKAAFAKADAEKLQAEKDLAAAQARYNAACTAFNIEWNRGQSIGLSYANLRTAQQDAAGLL